MRWAWLDRGIVLGLGTGIGGREDGEGFLRRGEMETRELVALLHHGHGVLLVHS